MTIKELRALLATFPENQQVVTWHEAQQTYLPVVLVTPGVRHLDDLSKTFDKPYAVPSKAFVVLA